MIVNRASHFIHTRRGSRSLERSLQGITQALERALFAEEISRRDGLFQSLDARVKILSVLGLLLGVGLSRNLLVIACLYLLTLILGWVSAIPTHVLIQRVWLALPFFTGVMILPALFLTPGPTLWQLPLGLVITRTGLTTALFLLLRVSTSVSLTLLLILTTPWNTLLGALGVLRVPDILILMLGMTYRYVHLLLRTANDMFLARNSRVVGRMSTADQQRVLAAISATLLSKSLNMSSEVYLAMLSRGFRGTIMTLQPFHMHGKDWLWCSVLLSLALLAVLLGR